MEIESAGFGVIRVQPREDSPEVDQMCENLVRVAQGPCWLES